MTLKLSFWQMLRPSRRISLATMRCGWLSWQRARDVEVLAVEEDPDLGALGRRLALARLLLDEVADRPDRAVERLVEDAVDAQRRVDADGADGDAAVGIARHHRRRDGRGRAVEGDGGRDRGLCRRSGRVERTADRGEEGGSTGRSRAQLHDTIQPERGAATSRHAVKNVCRTARVYDAPARKPVLMARRWTGHCGVAESRRRGRMSGCGSFDKRARVRHAEATRTPGRFAGRHDRIAGDR